MGAEIPIARRNLLADKAKLFVALGGVTLAVLAQVHAGAIGSQACAQAGGQRRARP
jgi:hypothetical protein